MEEHHCQYVSSRGILKSTTIHSKTPQSSIRRLINYEFKLTPNNTIYICSSAMQHFLTILPQIKTPFILVSGDCDEVVPVDIFTSKEQLYNFLDNTLLLHWFAQNNIMKHSKITTIPIGMDYHTMSQHQNHPWGKQLSPIQQEEQIIQIHKPPFYERQPKCYSNFHFFMTTRFGSDRKQAYETIPKELVYYEPEKIERYQSWLNQTQYAFVISPHGNGMDCHRTWEALNLGCIPIVRKSPIDVLYEDLPVLIVNEWRDITQELLTNTIEEFKNRTFKMDKLRLKYWMDKINGQNTS
jgi:hypothetical protein